MLTVTTNRANDLIVSYWNRSFEPLPDSIYEIPAPEKDLSGTDVYEMIDSLSETVKKTVYAYYIYGYSLREIADKTGCTQNAVKARLARGRKQMKSMTDQGKLY